MTRAGLLCCFLVAALASCGASNSPLSMELGTEVTLSPGASAAFKPADIVVEFVGVAADSRCPRDVTCMWAGEVKAIFSIRNARQPPARHEIVEGKYASSGEYRITLVRVLPEPVASTRIPPENYRATLLLQKL